MGTPSSEDPFSAPNEELRKLQAVTDAALAHLTVDELLDELLTRIREALDADTCAVLLLDDTGTELIARAAKGLEEEVAAGVRIPVGKGFAGRVAATKAPVVIEDIADADVLNPILREKGVKSLLGVPLLEHGRVIGVVHVGTLTQRDFDARDVEFLEIVAARAALAIDRATSHEELLRLSEIQREFVALAAHELRSPAAAVYGLAATLRERLKTLAAETVEEVVATLHEQSERMRRLVEQLLDLSRLDARTVEITRAPVAIRPHLEQIVRAVAPNRRDVRVRAPAGLAAAIDAVAVEHVVTNLLTNALSYGRPPVTVSAEHRDRHVRIAVEDAGEGVRPEFVPFLFERFRRSESSRERAVGSGLGLAIARSYARAHGGDLIYEPRDRGARFELVIPADGNG